MRVDQVGLHPLQLVGVIKLHADVEINRQDGAGFANQLGFGLLEDG